MKHPAFEESQKFFAQCKWEELFLCPDSNSRNERLLYGARLVNAKGECIAPRLGHRDYYPHYYNQPGYTAEIPPPPPIGGIVKVNYRTNEYWFLRVG